MVVMCEKGGENINLFCPRQDKAKTLRSEEAKEIKKPKSLALAPPVQKASYIYVPVPGTQNGMSHLMSSSRWMIVVVDIKGEAAFSSHANVVGV